MNIQTETVDPRTEDPRFFYRFEITRADGATYPLIIAEDGLILQKPELQDGFDFRFEAVLLS